MHKRTIIDAEEVSIAGFYEQNGRKRQIRTYPQSRKRKRTCALQTLCVPIVKGDNCFAKRL